MFHISQDLYEAENCSLNTIANLATLANCKSSQHHNDHINNNNGNQHQHQPNHDATASSINSLIMTSLTSGSSSSAVWDHHQQDVIAASTFNSNCNSSSDNLAPNAINGTTYYHQHPQQQSHQPQDNAIRAAISNGSGSGGGEYKCTRPNCQYGLLKSESLSSNAIDHQSFHRHSFWYTSNSLPVLRCNWPNCFFAGCIFAETLTTHKRLHTEPIPIREKPYKCLARGCFFSARNFYTFEHHLLHHCIKADLVCGWPLCGFGCWSLSELREHQRRDHCSRTPSCTFVYLCPIQNCAYATTNFDELHVHIDSVHVTNPTSHHHNQQHQQPSRFSCDWSGCGKSFNLKSTLAMHSLSHQVPYKCSEIDCTFCSMSSHEVNQHEWNDHYGESDVWGRLFYNCQFNYFNTIRRKSEEAATNNSNNMTPQLEGILNPPPVPAIAAPAPIKVPGSNLQKGKGKRGKQGHQAAEYQHNQSMSNLLNSHSHQMGGSSSSFLGGNKSRPRSVSDPSKRRFSCEWHGCKFTAKHLSQVKIHLRTHTGEKPFKCSWDGCGAAFATKINLKTHFRRHTGERPFKCGWDGCERAFAQEWNMIIHRRIHTGEKPYVCEIEGCGWAFAQKYNLVKHKLTHQKGGGKGGK